MRTELIGYKFESHQFEGAALSSDGCIYSISTNYRPLILKIDPTDDSTNLIDPDLEGEWNGCIAGLDGCIYGIPERGNKILKFDPSTQKVTLVGEELRRRGYFDAAVGPNNRTLYFFPLTENDDIDDDNERRILRFDPIDESSMSLVGDDLEGYGWEGAVLAGDECFYLMPFNARTILRFDPSDESTTYIGDGGGGKKWVGAVLGEGGTVYGIPYNHDKMLKIDVVNKPCISFVSLDDDHLGGVEEVLFKYNGGVLGFDNCIYMIPCDAKFVVRFDPITGHTSTVGQNLGNEVHQYVTSGVLAPNDYIYLTPCNAKQVLKIRSWDNWIYLKYRLLVEEQRAVGRAITDDSDLNVVQHFIIHTNDDVFRTVLEMLL